MSKRERDDYKIFVEPPERIGGGLNRFDEWLSWSLLASFVLGSFVMVFWVLYTATVVEWKLLFAWPLTGLLCGRLLWYVFTEAPPRRK